MEPAEAQQGHTRLLHQLRGAIASMEGHKAGRETGRQADSQTDRQADRKAETWLNMAILDGTTALEHRQHCLPSPCRAVLRDQCWDLGLTHKKQVESEHFQRTAAPVRVPVLSNHL